MGRHIQAEHLMSKCRPLKHQSLPDSEAQAIEFGSETSPRPWRWTKKRPKTAESNQEELQVKPKAMELDQNESKAAGEQ